MRAFIHTIKSFWDKENPKSIWFNTTFLRFWNSRLIQFLRLFFKQLFNSKIETRAKAVTFSFVLAIPPLLVFFLSLVPLLPVENILDTILNALWLILQNESTYNAIRTVIEDFALRVKGGYISIGLLTTLFFSSNGMMALMDAFDRELPYVVHRPGWKDRIRAILLTILVMVVVIFFGIALIIQADFINQYLLMIFDSTLLPRLFSFAIIVLLVFVTIATIYRYGPSLKKNVPFWSIGAMITTLGFGLITVIFFYVINHFINYNAIYGPIGSLVALLVWMQFLSYLMLIGYELNLSIYLGKMYDPIRSTVSTKPNDDNGNV